MSDLVGNPEDRFSHNEAHIFINMQKLCYVDKDLVMHVLQDLCIKIWKNEYINLAAFLKKNKQVAQRATIAHLRASKYL